MEAMRALILTVIVLNLVSKSLSFLLYCNIYSTLQYKQFSVLFIDSSSRSEEKFLKISQNKQEKT